MKQKELKTAHGCLQILAALVVILFVLLTVPIVLLVTLSGTVTSRESIKYTLTIDEFMRTFMVEAITADIQQRYAVLNLPPPPIDARNLQGAVNLLVPPGWIDEALDDGIDNVYNFLEDGRTDDYVLSYMPVLENFRSEAGREAMTIIVAHYPACPDSQIPPLTYENRNVEIPCLPADRSTEQMADDVYKALVAGFNSDPEILASGGAERLVWPADIRSQTAEIRRAYEIVEQLQWLWLVPIGLLVLITLFAVRSLYSLGIWFGWPLLLTGLLIPVPGLALSVLYTDLLYSALNELGIPEEELGQMTTLLLFNVADSLRDIWVTAVLLQAALMFILGLGGLFLARYLKKKAKGSSLAEIYFDNEPKL